MTGEADRDRYAADLVLDGCTPELLRVFNAAAVLAPADVHLAGRLMSMVGVDDELVGLAVALAGRAPRVGHVSVDLATVRSSVVVGEEDAGLDALPWPDPAAWVALVGSSPLVECHHSASMPSAGTGPGGSGGFTGPGGSGGFAGPGGGAGWPLTGPEGEVPPGTGDGRPEGNRPLHLAGSRLYLDRYWRDEIDVAADLRRRAASAPADYAALGQLPADWLRTRLDALFPGVAAADQRRAAAVALSGWLTVIAGGPGTGKTTTVARLLALMIEQAVQAGTRPPLVGLAAPTGKAAARMEEAIRAEAARMDLGDQVQRRLASLAGFTLHRLLGFRPDRTSRFRHHRGHRLPHDVVVVDEASMVSLALMARLAEAVRPDARLILVGDPEQLVSVEAGAVLADIVGSGPATGSAHVFLGQDRRPAGGHRAPASPSLAGGEDGPLAGRVAVLRTNHRFSGALADLAGAIREGDADRAVQTLRAGGPAVNWLESDQSEWSVTSGEGTKAAALRSRLVDWASGLVAAGRAGDGPAALEALQQHRLLCAHREGPSGVAAWNRRLEEWLAVEVPGLDGEGAWYAGRPVMVTANDYSLQLFNGDTGVVVTTSAARSPSAPPATALAVAFPGPDGYRSLSPYRLSFIDTVYATTVHKSQGSEFDRVTLVLPAEASRLLTRELLYTAVTRARQEVLVVGTEVAVRRAVDRPLTRASGLAARLWTV